MFSDVFASQLCRSKHSSPLLATQLDCSLWTPEMILKQRSDETLLVQARVQANTIVMLASIVPLYNTGTYRVSGQLLRPLYEKLLLPCWALCRPGRW